MPSPIPLPKSLKRVMVSFRALPAIVKVFRNHVPKKSRSQWLERALLEKLEREGVKVEENQNAG